MSELSGNAEPQLGIAGEEAKLGLGVPGKSVPGWHSRGYLPHYDSTSVHQTITFRLADSLPQVKLRQLEDELKILADNKRDITRRTRIQEWLDAGMGCGALRHPDMASLMQETLWKFHGERYGLVAWCIMPNHVHLVIQPSNGHKLPRIMHGLKSYTAHKINDLLDRSGPVWKPEYFDHLIRSQAGYEKVIAYVVHNPLKAGLPDWKWVYDPREK